MLSILTEKNINGERKMKVWMETKLKEGNKKEERLKNGGNIMKLMP